MESFGHIWSKRTIFFLQDCRKIKQAQSNIKTTQLNFKSLLAQLSDLESALMRYSCYELDTLEAARLKAAFASFRKRVESNFWDQQEQSFLAALSPSERQSASTKRLLRQTSEAVENHLVPQKKSKKKTILLAEHDTRVAAFFIKHLHKAGFDVLWASYPSMAETLVKNGAPDAVICSTYSRESFGKETLQFIRDTYEKYIPVIVVSGGAHSDALRDTITLGADDYLAQHITAAELVGRVERVMK